MSVELHTLTGAYAVDALSPEERARFEEHLAACTACAEEVHGLSAAAARLGGADAVAPPARMRAEVLARISTVRQLPPLTEPAGGDVVPLSARRRGGWRDPWRRVLAAAAAVATVAAVGLGVVSNDLRGRADRADQLEAQAAAVARVLTAPDARTVTTAIGGGGRAAVVASAQQGRVVFVGDGLGAPPRGKTYQLWYVGTAGARSAGVFEPGADGRAAVVLEGAPGPDRTVAMTVEPEGGSKRPSTKPVFGVQIPPA